MATQLRQNIIFFIGAVLAILWLGWVGWQAVATLNISHGWHRLSMSEQWVLLIVVAIWAGVLSWFFYRHRRYFNGFILAAGLLISGAILTTSGQLGSGLVVAGLVLLAWLVGLLIFRLLKLGWLETWVLSISMGLGMLATLTFAIGLVGWLNKIWVFGITGVLFVSLSVLLRNDIKLWAKDVATNWSNISERSWLALVCIVIITVFVIINLIGALAPEVTFDALKSHLALAKIYTTEQQVSGVPYSIGSYWPLNAHMLYTLGYLLGGETSAKLLHFLAGLLTMATVYSIGRRVDSPLTGLVTATIFYTTPLIAWESTTSYIDLFITMYVGGAIVLLLIWIDNRQRPSIAAGIGLFLGFALGIKPMGGVIALGIGLVMLYYGWLNRAHHRLFGVMPVLVTAVVTTLLGGIWYLRAYLLTGNPVFPFLNGIFLSPQWYPQNENFNYAVFGFGTSLPALVQLPWRLTFQTSHFVEALDGAVGILFLAFVPLSLLAPHRVKRLGVVAFVTFIFGLFWLYSVQYVRYLFPALIGLAVIAAWGIVVAHRQLQHKLPKLSWLLPLIFILFAVINLPLLFSQHLNTSTPIPYQVVLGQVSRQTYRNEHISSYSVFEYINQHLDKNARIYGVNNWFQYLSNYPLLSPYFSVEGNAILNATSEAELRQALARSGITHIVIDAAKLPEDWRWLVHSPGFLTKNTSLEYGARGVYLYSLVTPGSAETCAGTEQIQNGNFEIVENGQPVAWIPVGSPTLIDASIEAPGQGHIIQVSNSSYYYQTLEVSADTAYTLSALSYSARDDIQASAQLKIIWLDQQDQAIEDITKTVDVGPEVQKISVELTAPKSSSQAKIYLTYQSGPGYFDDVSLTAVSCDGQ